MGADCECVPNVRSANPSDICSALVSRSKKTLRRMFSVKNLPRTAIVGPKNDAVDVGVMKIS